MAKKNKKKKQREARVLARDPLPVHQKDPGNNFGGRPMPWMRREICQPSSVQMEISITEAAMGLTKSGRDRKKK
jgi:hypothetical protein